MLLRLELPPGWSVDSIESLVHTIRAGGTPKRGVDEYWDGTIPFVKIEDVTRSSGVLDSAIESGLDPEKVLEVLLTGTASSTLLPRIGPKMINGDQAASFLATHFIKDLSIANDSAKNTGRSLPAAELCGKLFQRLVDNGGQKKGIQSLIEVYQKQLHD